MLYHLQPCFYSPLSNVILIDADFPMFGLTLRHNQELATGRPFPNRDYAIACRKNPRRKAYEGLLIEADPVDVFTVVYRWGVEAAMVAVHRIEYRLADHTFDAVSQDVFFWHAQGCADTMPIPTFHEVSMLRMAPDNWGDLSVSETFTLPTIERKHFKEFGGKRFPPFESAFCAEADTGG